MKNKILLWLDDIRDPANASWLMKYAPEYMTSGEVVWVKSYNKFVAWIEENGLPAKFAFDHDLGFVTIKDGDLEALLKSSKAEEEIRELGKTGYDACHWLVDYCMDNDIVLTSEFVYQTDNTVGKANMIGLIGNFKKFQQCE